MIDGFKSLLSLTVDSATATVAAGAIGAASAILATGITQLAAYVTEGRRQRREAASRWHDERRRLASALALEALRIDALLQNELGRLPANDEALQRLQRLLVSQHVSGLSALPSEVSAHDLLGDGNEMGMDVNALVSFAGTARHVREHVGKAEQFLADLTMLTGQDVAEKAERLWWTLALAEVAFDQLDGEDVAGELMATRSARRAFQEAVRRDLTGSMPDRSFRGWFSRRNRPKP
jgi:hypothetical protein